MHCNSGYQTQKFPSKFFINPPLRKERKVLKTILLVHLYKLFCELFRHKIRGVISHETEYYIMEKKILQLLIQGIIETEEYTMEGIAHYTRIPLDVLYDVALGFNQKSSITLAAKLADLYLQLKPEISQALIEKLLLIKEKSKDTFSCILRER